VQWDTHKRLIAIIDRQAGHKLPLVINSRGQSSLNVAVSLGRVLHDRGIDTRESVTDVTACAGKTEADCFALKRPGGPLEATLNTKDAPPFVDDAAVRIPIQPGQSMAAALTLFVRVDKPASQTAACRRE